MTEQEVQAAFERFAAPMLAEAPPGGEERAEVLAKYFWLGVIGGPQMEKGIWKTLKEQPGMKAEDIEAFRQWYLDTLKPAVTPEELEALRQRYGIDPKRPLARIEAVQEQILREVRFPSRRFSLKSKLARIFVLWGLGGSLYGASVGSLLASMEAARAAALIGGTGLGLVGAVAGVWYGFFYRGGKNRRAFGRVAVGTAGAVFSGLFGMFAGAMLVAFVGTLPGTIAGGVVGRLLFAGRKALGTAFGAFVGTGGGALIIALRRDQEMAILGAAWGVLAGVPAAILLLTAALGSLALMRRTPR